MNIHPHYDARIGIDLEDIYVRHKSAFLTLMQLLDHSIDVEMPDSELLARMGQVITHYRESMHIVALMEDCRVAEDDEDEE